MDDLGMDRAMEFIEFLGRRNRMQGHARPGLMSSREPWQVAGMSEPPRPLELNEMAALQSIPMLGGGIANLTEQARGMIEWAEDQIRKGRAS